jgi:hypothetical protein
MSDISILVIGGLVGGVGFVIIAALLAWRYGPVVVVAIWGRRSMGRVVAIERSDVKVRIRVSFAVADGRKFECVEPIAIKANVGESRTVRYSARRPSRATSCPRLRLIVEIVAPLVLFGVGGLGIFIGSLSTLFTDSKQAFYGVAGSSFLGVIGSILIYVSAHSLAQAKAWQRMATTRGVVIRVKPRSGGDSYPNPWVEYSTIDGRKIEYLDTQLTGYGPGQEVDVFYDPQYPEFTNTATDRAGQMGQSAIFGLGGFLFLVAGCGLVWAHIIHGS